MKLTDYLTSNLINAASLEPNVKIEATIVSVRDREFPDGTTKAIVYLDYDGKGVVLNQTRLKALIAAFGINPDNLIGKTVILSQGKTKFQGRDTPCVDIEPVVANRIATHGATVAAIGNRRGPPEPSERAPPLEHDGGPDDGPDGFDDSPF